MRLAGIGKAYPLQHGGNGVANLVRGDSSPRETVTNVLPDRHHREQREVLEHHVDRTAVRQDAAHRLAADAYVAFIRRDEAGDHAHSVVFPHPDGRGSKKLPCATANDSSWTATCAPSAW
jgi:hypothetical protein